MSDRQQLGVVTTRSGGLLIIDTGYLRIWSHDKVPFLPEDLLSSEESTRRANASVDLRIVGRDAERAGRMLGMSWHPLFVFDQDPDHPELEGKLKQVVRDNKLDARFEVISPRIPHRERVNLALQHGCGAGEVQFHGTWAVAIAGVPVGASLRVLGERMPAPEQDRWTKVVVECNPRIPISRFEKVGSVAVDYARLLIADFDALGTWEHEKSLDGLADYVFWGREAERVAQALDSPRLAAGEFGWLDIPDDVALKRGSAVEKHVQKHGLKLGCDFRPHSHHWQVMKETRTSPTESSTIELDGVKICNFMTTWGDGLFDVYRDLGALGELAQIRIEFIAA